MNLNMYTDVVLNELRSNVNLNVNNYISGKKFVKDFIKDYDILLYSMNYDVIYPPLDTTISKHNDDKKQWQIDFENAIRLHKEFSVKYNIPLYILSDERFIAYLTHDIYYDYMIKRWPIEETKLNRIKEKYFLPSGSQAFTRNTFLRLFWYPIITFDETNKDPYHLTKIAFEYADPVNQIMERKFSKNPALVKAALKAIENVEGSSKLNSKRTFYGKAINNILGMYCLDVLNEKDLVSLFENEIRKIIKMDVYDDTVIEEE